MSAAVDLQTVLRRFLPALSAKRSLSPRQWQVCAHLRDCRTEAMGSLWQQCDHCDYGAARYLACRDRHCPKCQGRACAQWAQRQAERLLAVRYYHLVFTLPHRLNVWVRSHPQAIYAQLFQSVWATLSSFAAQPQRLGGQLGATLVLHTWGQTLTQHVHLHGLIAGEKMPRTRELWRVPRGQMGMLRIRLNRLVQGRSVRPIFVELLR